MSSVYSIYFQYDVTLFNLFVNFEIFEFSIKKNQLKITFRDFPLREAATSVIVAGKSVR